MGDSIRSYLAECFWPGVSQAELKPLDRRATQSARLTSGTAEEVRYRGSMLMPEDEVVFCFFEGPSADAVAAAARSAEIPFARIVESSGVPDLDDRRDEAPVTSFVPRAHGAPPRGVCESACGMTQINPAADDNEALS